MPTFEFSNFRQLEPALLLTLSQLGMKNLKIRRAFENQRIIFRVEFLSSAKVYGHACSFTWNFTTKTSIKVNWKRSESFNQGY